MKILILAFKFSCQPEKLQQYIMPWKPQVSTVFDHFKHRCDILDSIDADHSSVTLVTDGQFCRSSHEIRSPSD